MRRGAAGGIIKRRDSNSFALEREKQVKCLVLFLFSFSASVPTEC